jgi:tRNA threonylcarbamoyladenosine biosynthesis protein TsaB
VKGQTVLLAIDTSTPIGSVALRSHQGVAGLITVSVQTTHSEGLMPAIDTLLQHTHTESSDIEAVACVTGPGSYTGLRIGIATAQGIALANNATCVGIPAFDVLARALPYARYPLCPLMPARKGWVYARMYRWDEIGPRPISEEMNVQPDELVKDVHEPTLFYGPGFPAVREMLQEILQEELIACPPVHDLPRADLLTELAARELEQGHGIDPSLLQPHYLGPSQAEVNWKKRNG